MCNALRAFGTGLDFTRPFKEIGNPKPSVIDIALLPEFRGRGWGSAVLQDLMEDAGLTGRGVSIHVEKNNPAMSLYKRLGFIFVESNGIYDLMEWRTDTG